MTDDEDIKLEVEEAVSLIAQWDNLELFAKVVKETAWKNGWLQKLAAQLVDEGTLNLDLIDNDFKKRHKL